MAGPHQARRTLSEGFEGEIAGLELSDLIQLGVHNGFSGCISVQSGSGSGLIFLRDGQIVHAEQGAKVGDEAFYGILRWTSGRFSLQPNVASTRATIRKGWQHLILEAHRFIDEDRVGRAGQPLQARADPSRGPAGRGGMGRLRQIPGVARVVLHRAEGGPLGDESYEAEELAGRALYLAMVGRQLGATFRAGDMLSATVEGGRQHLLVFAAAGHLLSVLVDGDAQVRAVEAEVRRALGGGH